MALRGDACVRAGVRALSGSQYDDMECSAEIIMTELILAPSSGPPTGSQYDNTVCAACNGDIASLQVLVASGDEIDWYTWKTAARYGKLKVLEWLFEHDQLPKPSWSCSTSKNAAKYGHPILLEWLYHKRCPYDTEMVADVTHDSCVDFVDKYGERWSLGIYPDSSIKRACP